MGKRAECRLGHGFNSSVTVITRWVYQPYPEIIHRLSIAGLAGWLFPKNHQPSEVWSTASLADQLGTVCCDTNSVSDLTWSAGPRRNRKLNWDGHEIRKKKSLGYSPGMTVKVLLKPWHRQNGVSFPIQRWCDFSVNVIWQRVSHLPMVYSHITTMGKKLFLEVNQL